MSQSTLNHNAVIYHEMMAHIPLFAHRKPRNIAILNDQKQGVIQEVLKHSTVTQIWQIMTQDDSHKNADTRIKYCYDNNEACLASIEPGSLDIIIITQESTPTDYQLYFDKLHQDGILIQPCESPFHLGNLKATQHRLKTAGFRDVQALQFPEPSYTSGWRSAIMAIKYGTIKRPREKDIFNKSFTTHYYNLDIHKAAFALPEFMRMELEG
jgi:spermidine synthase